MNTTPHRPDIARDLQERADASRAFRERFARGQLSDEETRLGIHRTRANAGVLRRLLGGHGWLGRSLVGAAGAKAAWRLALHADHDPELQRLALRLLTEAVRRQEAPIQQWAHLHDRCLVGAGHLQLYGTQHRLDAGGQLVRLPVSVPEELDSRRATVGLPPAAVAYDALRRRYVPVPNGTPGGDDPPGDEEPVLLGQLVGSAA
ncbi:hypothetical protein OG897_35645 [Streptomyces sp. NBC_00237]|uniref:DUF6624 domain-containing protein n=1 Tax=Streptomyces sp. NBC_00237 TaxID=2975687 RepID=UPI00224FC088|nr:DUF6624 domain-containing protein [Streptomyces sp. NBC_00237]MCX5206726.1 hypothetical protein [Streptomyces sp. NBC_00237]